MSMLCDGFAKQNRGHRPRSRKTRKSENLFFRLFIPFGKKFNRVLHTLCIDAIIIYDSSEQINLKNR